MPQYLDKLTPAEVREVVREIERAIKVRRRAKSYDPDNFIIFAPQQVVEVLKAEEGANRRHRLKVKILDDYFTVRIGAMPDVRRKHTDIFKGR